MNVPESNFKAWLAKAENDLLNIENNLSASRIPWDTVCFHAQQAAEKLLKAYLVYHGHPLIRTHDLVALLAACTEINADLAALQQDCQRLSYYGVSSRYPADLYEPNEKDGRDTIEAVHRVRVAIMPRLK
jgi:HEPN domain-containing protein